MDADVIVVGAGLSGLVVADELARARKRVILLDQENLRNLGGQAFWSFGGLFLVDSPEQRRLGIRDSADLAWQDWTGSAAWDRVDGDHAQDRWAREWGRAFVEFAAGGMRSFIRSRGISLTPMVGWAERGSLRAAGHGNSVPRFHVPWGTGTGVSEPFARRARRAANQGLLTLKNRHRVDELIVHDGACVGVAGSTLVHDAAARGARSSRAVTGTFRLTAQAVVIATGGIGANHDLVREYWPPSMGAPPRSMITGVPAYVDGRMHSIAEEAGARIVNKDRMWHYTEGVRNFDPIWPDHGIRILPGPSSVWLDAIGRRLPNPALPGYDTLATLRHLRTEPLIAEYDHSWFIATRRILAKEFALSGSEQNPDITSRSLLRLAASRLGSRPPGPVQAFLDRGEDFVTAPSVDELVGHMNRLTRTPLLESSAVAEVIAQRDSQLANPFSKDAQVMGMRNARKYRGDRLTRVAAPHRILDPKAGPLVAVKLHTITRKTLGGLQTDLNGQVLGNHGRLIGGLFAVGEAAGFGGGGAHGYNALEGTFLGGCLFTGLTTGRHLSRAL